MAVNLRLAEPREVAHIVVDHFDGLHGSEDLPRAKCIAHMWF